MCEQSVHMGTNIKLIHIPGHAGRHGNIKADRLAKDTAFKIASGGIAAPVNISVTTAFSICAEIQEIMAEPMGQ